MHPVLFTLPLPHILIKTLLFGLVVILTVSAVVLLMLGVGSFSLGFSKSQRDGGLSRWVKSGLSPSSIHAACRGATRVAR